jgi:Uri superfamily endonuclease
MSQVYVLLISAQGSAQVGSLGPMEFWGTYAYVGSAWGRAGQRRIERHVKVAAGRPGRAFWHVDYLLRLGRLEAVVAARTEERLECSVASKIAQVAAEAVPRFGCSDCRCRSHLFRLENDSVDRVCGVMAEAGLRPEVIVLPEGSGRKLSGPDYRPPSSLVCRLTRLD